VIDTDYGVKFLSGQKTLKHHNVAEEADKEKEIVDSYYS